MRTASKLTLLAAVLAGVSGARAAGPDDAQRLTRGWEALRAMDCARCHGRDYGGCVAPSLVAAVRDGTRERFVLEGDIVHGMPGYRSQPVVVAEIAMRLCDQIQFAS